ncbi:MAG: ABC transporter ATP-binding protein [Actinomycetota bacterium]|jgi:ABC-2 type transport system ATP-binding protein|nr:ABC transporter ATP-binding protein [Actinomycetota bacterium]
MPDEIRAPGDVVIGCSDLVVRYGDVTAVDGVSFAVRAGEVVALLGPNGAGKTSTVECLEGYRHPASGRIRVLGLDPIAQHEALVAKIGVMLQRGGVYPMLGPRRALRLFAAYYQRARDPEELLDLVSLSPVAGTPWRHLSGGEQQRLSLALALVGRPEAVFLDEPTAGVDAEGRQDIRRVVAGLAAEGVGVLLTTHELSEAERMADRVVILRHGQVVAEGTPAGLAAGGQEIVRFGAPAGLDAGSLADALGVPVTEEEPGRYVVRARATPVLTATLAAWLADRELALTDLRSGRTLEEAYLDAVGEGDGSDTRREASP